VDRHHTVEIKVRHPEVEITAENTTTKQRSRPFKKGQSVNLAGKAPRTRNKAVRAALTLLHGQIEGLDSGCNQQSVERRYGGAANLQGGSDRSRYAATIDAGEG